MYLESLLLDHKELKKAIGNYFFNSDIRASRNGFKALVSYSYVSLDAQIPQGIVFVRAVIV